MVCLQSLHSVGVVTIVIVVLLCPFMYSVFLVLFCMPFVIFFSFGLLHVLLYVFWFCHLFVISFLHIILHGYITWFDV